MQLLITSKTYSLARLTNHHRLGLALNPKVSSYERIAFALPISPGEHDSLPVSSPDASLGSTRASTAYVSTPTGVCSECRVLISSSGHQPKTNRQISS